MSPNNKLIGGNRQYDLIQLPKIPVKQEKPAPREIPRCEHKFIEQINIITEYSDDISENLIAHCRAGFFIESFSGKYNICNNAMSSWMDNPNPKYDRFRSAVNIAISASLHYYNEELQWAIQNRDTELINTFRSIVADVMRVTPKLLRDRLPVPETKEERETRLKVEAAIAEQTKLETLANAFKGNDV